MDAMGIIPSSNTLIIVGAYYVFSAAVSSLPVPKATSSPYYEWLYKFANTLSANVTALRGKAAFEPKPDMTTQIVATHTDTLTSAEVPKP